MNKNIKKIAVGSDHAGLDLKLELVKFLEELSSRKESPEEWSYVIQDLGTYTNDSVDYPDFGKAVAKAVAKGKADVGLCICGTGIGISIAANRIKGVRAALVYDETTAKLAREHNDANVICMGGRLIDSTYAKECLKIFLETEFKGGRHKARIKKLG